MKGGSREAKGHKTTGGGRTWYGKRETLTPLSHPIRQILFLIGPYDYFGLAVTILNLEMLLCR